MAYRWLHLKNVLPEYHPVIIKDQVTRPIKPLPSQRQTIFCSFLPNSVLGGGSCLPPLA